MDSTTLAVSRLLAPFLAVTVVGSGGWLHSTTLAVSLLLAPFLAVTVAVVGTLWSENAQIGHRDLRFPIRASGTHKNRAWNRNSKLEVVLFAQTCVRAPLRPDSDAAVPPTMRRLASPKAALPNLRLGTKAHALALENK